MDGFQRILAATDFSPASQPAFDEACRIASGCGARLFVLHAYQVPTLASLKNAPASVYEDFERAVRSDGEKRLEALLSRARARGIAAVGLLRQGLADEEILDAAKKGQADLIVMGTHGRRGPSRVLLGSVASRVVCGSTCPVLTVRAASKPSRDAAKAAERAGPEAIRRKWRAS
jgi:nucleotide-binding universal stress UspA family protein